jgi:hypothetical protein
MIRVKEPLRTGESGAAGSGALCVEQPGTPPEAIEPPKFIDAAPIEKG